MENKFPTELAPNGHRSKGVSKVSVTKPKIKKAVAATGNSDTKLRAQRSSQRAQSPPLKSWFVDTVAVTISRLPSSSAVMLAAAPVSRNATDPKKPASELREPIEKHRPRSSWNRREIRMKQAGSKRRANRHLEIGADSDHLARETALLLKMDDEALREKWAQPFGLKPSPLLSRHFIIRSIAYRLQEKTSVGLSHL